jgi:dipeptidyl aminopeptidase/acylaminoacyl peptidase
MLSFSHEDPMRIKVPRNPHRIAGCLAAAAIGGLTAAGTRDISPADIISAPHVLDVAFSPDGARLLYEVRRTELEKNHYVTELWIARSDGSEPPQHVATGPPVVSQYQSLRAQWAPDGKSLIYFAAREGRNQLWRLTLADRRERPLLERSWSTADPRSLPPDAYHFSPDGRTIAVAAVDVSGSPAATPMHGIISSPEWPAPRRGTQTNAGLWLYDERTKAIERVTPPALHVNDVTWSPDGSRLVFAAAPSPVESPYKDDLYLLDVAARTIRTLVAQPGWDHQPVWSPDGRWIAFVTQKGKQDWNYNSWVALVSPEGGAPRYLFDRFQRESGSMPRELSWTADSRAVIFAALYRLAYPVFRGSIESGVVEPLTPTDRYTDRFSVSRDSRRLAVSMEDITTPPDVYVADLPWNAPRRLTTLHPGWDEIKPAQVETVSWKSQDGRFDVQGVVIRPPDYQPGRRYPTIVFLAGGPSMVRMGFMLDEPIYPHLVWAARGYVVFAPNNRGRGGFGVDFRQAMPDNADFMPGPYADVTAGIDHLIARGIADPERLAITGFSFGAGLTAYAITRTNRFKAAGIFEGFPNNLRSALRAAGVEDRRTLLKDQRGFGSPWDPAARRILLANSPIFEMDKVKTPTLLEYGANSAAREDGNELASALQFFNVPSLYVVYPRSGHSIDEPRLRQDSFERQLAWFDYWVLGKGGNPALQATK